MLASVNKPYTITSSGTLLFSVWSHLQRILDRRLGLRVETGVRGLLRAADERGGKSVISLILLWVAGNRLAGIRDILLSRRESRAFRRRQGLPFCETGRHHAKQRKDSFHRMPSFKDEKLWPTQSMSSATHVITAPGRSRRVVLSSLPVQARCACCCARCWRATHRGRSC